MTVQNMDNALAHLMTVEEAAAALHATVPVPAIRAAIRAGQLRARRIGKRYYITAAALREFVECPAPESPLGSISAQTRMNGSFETRELTSGPINAARAVERLLKKR